MITLVPITEADLPDSPAHSTLEERSRWADYVRSRSRLHPHEAINTPRQSRNECGSTVVVYTWASGGSYRNVGYYGLVVERDGEVLDLTRKLRAKRVEPILRAVLADDDQSLYVQTRKKEIALVDLETGELGWVVRDGDTRTFELIDERRILLWRLKAAEVSCLFRDENFESRGLLSTGDAMQMAYGSFLVLRSAERLRFFGLSEEGFDDQGEIEEVTTKMFSRTGRVYVCDVERDWFVVDG